MSEHLIANIVFNVLMSIGTGLGLGSIIAAVGLRIAKAIIKIKF